MFNCFGYIADGELQALLDPDNNNNSNVACKSIARQRPQQTHGQQYSKSVFFVSVQLARAQ
jgi:hypothetical protein